MMKYSEDAIEAIVYLFEQANGRELESYDLDVIKEHSLVGHDPSVISNYLVDVIQSDSSLAESYRTAVYWALSKRHDKGLISFFIERLATEVSLNSQSVFQLLIALDNLEENVFSEERGGSYSSLDDDLNLCDAQLYLNKQGS